MNTLTTIQFVNLQGYDTSTPARFICGMSKKEQERDWNMKTATRHLHQRTAAVFAIQTKAHEPSIHHVNK